MRTSLKSIQTEILPVVTLAMGLPLAGHSEVTSCSVLLLCFGDLDILEIQKLTEYKF